jgi:phenylalanyl-tRNA synthetase beta chain
MALIVDNPIEAQGVLDFIDALGQALIGGVEIFDVYEGPPVPQGKKSIALRLTYQSFERSLTDSEVNGIHETMTKKVLKKFNAQLPQGGGRSTVTQ